MTVLIGTTVDLYSAGGLQSHVWDLSNALSACGVSNHVVGPDVPGTPKRLWCKMDALLRSRANIARARAVYGRVFLESERRSVLSKATEMLTRREFQVIHAHDALFASSLVDLGTPLVLTVHGPLSRELQMWLGNEEPGFVERVKERERQAYHGAKAIIAVDSGQKHIVVNEFGVQPEKVRVIYNAVNTDLFSPGHREGIDRYDPEPFFLVPRRLVKKNGVSVAIEAFQCIADLHAMLWIAGDGPERPHLEEIVRARKLQKRVRFLGAVNRDQMITLIKRCFGVIIPSVPTDGVVEASSISALEGMSTGKPVFASNIGGLAEIIEHGKTGFLFEAGDADALGTLMRKALRGDQASLHSVGDRAREYVVKHHSMTPWIEQITEVYHGVTARIA